MLRFGAGPEPRACHDGSDLGDEFFDGLAADLQARRDLLCAGLSAAGFEPVVPQGTYYITADIRPLGASDGLDFCRSLPERCGVVAVPVQVLCDDKAMGAPFVRFAACKRPEVLEQAVERLAALAPS